MFRKSLTLVLFLFLVLGSFVFAQDNDVQTVVDYKVNKMQKTLHLTDEQATAIKPIIKEYLIKRQTVLQQGLGEGILDHENSKDALKGLKEKEYQQLSKILSQEQLQQWIDKENLMAALNPDSSGSTEDDVNLTPNGANFKF